MAYTQSVKRSAALHEADSPPLPFPHHLPAQALMQGASLALTAASPPDCPERCRSRGVSGSADGEPDEEPVDEHVAQRRKQRRWRCTRLLDRGDATPAEDYDE